MNTDEIGIVILAAGGSSRFGEPKQLLRFAGTSFLRRAVDAALSSNCGQVVVVLGQDPQMAIDEIGGLPVEIVVNNDWQDGISSALKCGLNKLLEEEPELSAVVFMLCDQPFVDRDTISALIDGFRSTQKRIVACEYEKTPGVPALFSHELFADLLSLEGDVGAKQIIRAHIADVHPIKRPEVFFDIDRPEDYKKLLTPKQ